MATQIGRPQSPYTAITGHVRLHPEDMAQIKVYCEATGASRSAAIRIAVREGLRSLRIPVLAA